MTVEDFTFDLTISIKNPITGKWKDKLNRVVVSDGNKLPAVAEMSFDDPYGRFVTETGIATGDTVSVAVTVSSSPTAVKLFVGEVVGFQVSFDGNGSFTTVYAEDAANRLMRGSKVVNHKNQTASQIAKKTATDAGVPVGQIKATQPILETKSQANVDGWSFLQDLAVENHMELAVVDGKLQFRPPTLASTAPALSTPARDNPFVIDRQMDVLSLRANATSVGQVSGVSVRGWNTADRSEIAKRVPAASSDEQAPGTKPAAAVTPFGKKDLLVAEEPYRTVTEVNAVAAAAAAEVTASYVDLDIVVRGEPKLRAGVAIALVNVGKPFDGKYTISATRHVLVPKVFYETEIAVSGGNDRSTLGLVTGATETPRPNQRNGLEWGVVTNVKAGLEPGNKHPEQVNQPWVKLRFPLMAGAKDYESGWVPTVQPGGTGGGGVLCPEVNDVVIVGFLGGLLDYPVVLGGVYVGKDKPAPLEGPLVDKITGKVNTRSMASRDGKAVEVLSARAPGPSGVRLRTAKDKLLVHLNDRTPSKPLLTVHSDGSIEIDAGTDLNLTAKNITIAAKQKLSLEGGSVDLTGKADTAIKGRIVHIN